MVIVEKKGFFADKTNAILLIGSSKPLRIAKTVFHKNE